MSKSPYETQAARTAIAIGYKNDEGIADMIMPRVQVGKKTFNYNDYGVRGEYDLPNDLIGRKGVASEVEYGSELREATCRDRGLFASVPKDDVDEAVKDSMPDPFNRAILKIAKSVNRIREVRVAGLVNDKANYEHVKTLAAAARFDKAGVNPLPVLLECLDTPLIRPNIGIIGQSTWTKVRTNPALVKAFNGSDGDAGAITKEFFAELLELNAIYIGKQRVNIAKPGKPAQYQRAWDKHMAFHYLEADLDADNALTWGFTGQYGTWTTDEVEKRPGEMGVRGGKRAFAGETVAEVIAAKGAAFFVENATG